MQRGANLRCPPCVAWYEEYGPRGDCFRSLFTKVVGELRCREYKRTEGPRYFGMTAQMLTQYRHPCEGSFQHVGNPGHEC